MSTYETPITETEETPGKDRKRFPTQTVTAIVAALALLLGIVALVEDGTRTVEHRMTAEDRHVAASCGALLVATQALGDDTTTGSDALAQVQGALSLLKQQASTRKMARKALLAIERAVGSRGTIEESKESMRTVWRWCGLKDEGGA